MTQAIRTNTWPRRLAGVSVLAIAVALGVHLGTYRGAEATVAGWLSGPLLGTQTFVSATNAVFFIDVGSADVFGLRVTTECTSGIITAFILGVSGLLIGSSRFRLGRVSAAALTGAATFAAVNMGRLLLVATASRTWGLDDGYRWTHTWAGSIVTLLGVVAACAVYLRILGIGGNLRRVIAR